MKGKIGWIIGALEIIIGFLLFFPAQMEMSSNSRYTWSQPYSPYEAQVIMTKWIGVALLISGAVWLVLKLYQMRYTNHHTQEINQVLKRGGTIKCSKCGLTLSANVKNCPRCGNIVSQSTSDIRAVGKNTNQFCCKCGNLINTNELFCSKCGQKIDK